MAQAICGEDDPALHEWLPNRLAACHFALDDMENAPSGLPVPQASKHHAS
jgi:hypothetical protein